MDEKSAGSREERLSESGSANLGQNGISCIKRVQTFCKNEVHNQRAEQQHNFEISALQQMRKILKNL